MSYTCKRCNYTTDILCNFKSHLKRVTKCKVAPGMEDISCNVLLDEIIPQHIKTSYCCKYCQRYFNFQSGKSRHEKDCSEKNASKNSLKNIVINDFGFENTSYLDQEMLKDCLKELDLKKLIDQLHFNTDHPENHNFRLKNINKKIFEYREDGKWMIDQYDSALRDFILNCGLRILSHFYKNNKKQLEKEINDEQTGYDACRLRQSIPIWLGKIENEDEILYKDLKKKIYFQFIQNRHIKIC